jgi:hypothetical protein
LRHHGVRTWAWIMLFECRKVCNDVQLRASPAACGDEPFGMA